MSVTARVIIGVVAVLAVVAMAVPAGAKSGPSGVAACRLIVKAQNQSLDAASSRRFQKLGFAQLRKVKSRRAQAVRKGATLDELAAYCAVAYGPATIGSVVTTTTTTTMPPV